MSELEYFELGSEVSLRDGFGRVLCYEAERRDDWLLLDADVAGGTGAKPLVQQYPDRVKQFGIAEQNMMAAAGGMADTGIIPVVSTFAAFGCMRAHEQFRTAIAYPGRNVKLCCSHVGLDVGPDGATAQMLEDFATMRAIPGVVVISPSCANEFMQAFSAILAHQGPVYMRIGRSPAPVITPAEQPFKIGKATRLKEGSDVTIIATGVMVARALEAAADLSQQGIEARVVNLSTIKPLDGEELLAAARETGCIVTAEDHNVHGGMGSAVAEYLVQHCPVPMRIVGVQDSFGKSGEHDELPAMYGIDAASVARAAKSLVNKPLLNKEVADVS
ncbi:transketolase family protein [Dasania marina]|uniref:transketolase family protein n=1 Tax=Dasania marina TaxID=471499 RepID=UPI00038055BE|nr:transketolase C-terminal domain-containing protein [Dasania marina]